MGKKQVSLESQTPKIPPKSVLKTTPGKMGDLLEKYRTTKICQIPATNNQVKPNIFEEFRPKPKSVLKYNIDQTDAKLQKQLKTGMAKIHLQQTTASYVLPPPDYVFPEDRTEEQEPKGIKYFSGGPPVYKFVDEIWLAGLEKKQARYRENLRKLQIENRKYMKMQVAEGHRKLMALVGPDWFQELSPQQLKTVDDLKNCILKDKKYKCITYTKDNIGELGLALRPNVKHIEKALNNCFECPVEFLLILYQLMDRQRKKYSINDRLLLSAVTHLTMRETLKELHIRIPSPPRPPKKPKLIRELPPKPRYKSVYLAPFDFVPCPRKYTGVYKNKHVQHPRSSYFAYVPELEQERQFETNNKRKKYINRLQSGITMEQQDEIVRELKSAQKIYEALVDFKPVPFLLKPSIYIPCDHVAKVQEELATENVEKELKEKDLSIPVPLEDARNDEREVELEKEPSVIVASGNISSELQITEKEAETETLNVARSPSPDCSCREYVQNMIETNLCQCEQCKTRRQESSTGTCRCMELYQQKIKTYEKFKQMMFEARQGLMPTQGQSVQMSNDAPELKCSCARIYREKLEERQGLANMPSIPLEKQKGVTSESHSTEEEKVASDNAAKVECTCLKLFKAYQERHVQCLDVYQKYLEKIEIDVRKYMEDIENNDRFEEMNPNEVEAKVEDDVEEKSHDQYIQTNKEYSIARRSETREEIIQDIAEEKHIPDTTIKCECGGEENVDSSIIYLCGDAIEAACTCTALPIVCEDTCCGQDDESDDESETSELHRFIILDQMPSKYSDQVNILKLYK
ncbi:hypothetical protein RI129_006291 [Pyrocoelia pectoralis]|uniref:DUF4770 domain-containing protein n=1 Tax=Pyrocoelia pectoralis TaxID=417401 RepID=A0AAN7ZPG0_9COLE